MKKNGFVFILFLVLMACSYSSKDNNIHTPQRQFIQDLNSNNTIEHHYWRQGGLFVQQQLYKNRDSIELQLKKIAPIKTFERWDMIEHDSLNCFEIGCYYTDSLTTKTAYLIAWKKENNQWLKELEVLYPFEVKTIVPTQKINGARLDWENLSNQHQPDSLAEKLYTPNAIYFNDGYIYKGTKTIAEKYAYMSDADWHIRLATEKTIQVTDSLFYDVGQYVSSGTGHYLIVWQLQQEGDWRVLLDFNF